MNFDFSRYPFKDVFPEEIKSDLVYKDVYPNGYNKGTIISVDNEILFDFGAESIGFFRINVRGKGKLRLDYAEWLGEIYDRYEEYMPCWYESPVDNVVVDSKDFETFTVNGRRTFRFLRVLVTEGSVEISEPTLKTVEARNPFDGSFFCSDQRVNDIYEISKRTTRLCMQEFIEDGIKRDGLCWITDSRVGALCNYKTFGNTEIIKTCLVYFLRTMRENGWISTSGVIGGAHQHPRNIDYMFDYVGGKTVEGTPSFYADCGEIYYAGYQADFLGMLNDYYHYSGDKAFVQKIWEFVRKIAEYAYTLDDEILSKSRFPKYSRRTVKWTDNLCDLGGIYCTLVYAIKDYVKLLEVFGTADDIEKANAAIAKFSEKAREYMDEEKRMWRKCDGDDKVYSPVAQSLAYQAGLCTKEELINALKSMPKDFTAYPDQGMSKYWMLKGIFEAGYVKEAFDWMTREWSALLDCGYTSCIERWVVGNMAETIEDISLSACHAWSAGPANFLPEFILGVKSLDDGYNKVKIEPNLCGLKFAFGSVPTPKGLIKVRVINGKTEYTVPDGIEVVK